jgi:membrane protein implicated in regulation of membrane protease activity
MPASTTVEEWRKSKGIIEEDYSHLRLGHTYKTVESYVDANRRVRREGEAWTFVGYTSIGAAESVVLFVSPDGRHVESIPIEFDEIKRVLPCFAPAAPSGAI